MRLNQSKPSISINKVKFTYQEISGIGYEPGVCRRDPSCIIKKNGSYYIWYTKVEKGAHLYPSGYSGTIWYATSSDEGLHWEEKGEAVATSQDGFDSRAVFTPNILVVKDRYYLTYTAVKEGFTNEDYSDINRTAIGMAIADSPDGPWKKLDKNPILESSRDTEKFDSFRVDDSCFVIRGDKICMYYKGRQWGNTGKNTKMGLAIADQPEGSYTRYNDGNPVQDSGHEVLVWPYKSGVMSLVSNVGPNGRTLQFTNDGINFKVACKLPKNYPKAPGAFRQDFSGEPDYDSGITWGVSMVPGKDPYLVRFQIKVK
ncbi:MAG: family 43 glycosylhydrolase [Candidatus Hodarchaeota archaeon]